MSHPTPTELVRLFKVASEDGTAEALAHLVACPRCRASIQPLAAALRTEPSGGLSPAGPSVMESRSAHHILNAVQGRLETAAADRENAPFLATEILARPASQRMLSIVEDETFASPALGHLLLDRAEMVVDDDPNEACHLAALAVAIAERLERPWTLLERQALLGRARSVEGEARRGKGDLKGAQLAHRAAFRHLDVLPVSAPERTDFCRYLARLRRDQGRDDEALALLSRAVEGYDGWPELRKAAEARLELAWMHLDDLEADEALFHLEQSIHEIGEEPGTTSGKAAVALWLKVRHGLALAYADLQRDAEAHSVLDEIRTAAEGRPRLQKIRLRVAEADIRQRLDDAARAEVLLAEAWHAFREEGQSFEALDALLALAQLLAEQDAASEIVPLREAIPSFVGLSSPVREAVDFGLSFAVRHGLAGIEVLEGIKSYLRRARHAPALEMRLAKQGGGRRDWEQVEADLRFELARWAGLDEVAHLPSPQLSPQQRRRLAWAAEARAEIELVFAGVGGCGLDPESREMAS